MNNRPKSALSDWLRNPDIGQDHERKEGKPEQRGVNHVWSIGGSDEVDGLSAFCAVHFSQQLVVYPLSGLVHVSPFWEPGHPAHRRRARMGLLREPW